MPHLPQPWLCIVAMYQRLSQPWLCAPPVYQDGWIAVTDFDLAEADLSLAALFAGWAMADELQRRLAADGFTDARFADGVIFQHLVGEPLTIGGLADRLGVTQQAASKSVLDLERRGYTEHIPAPGDSRAH